MSKKSIAPKWESAEDLSRRAMMGESDALIRLLRLSDEAEDDDDIEKYVSAFDDAALLYAMGISSDEVQSWSEFLQVIRYVEKLNDLRSDLVSFREREHSIRFEIAVLEEAVATAANEEARAHFAAGLDMARCSLQFSQQDIAQMETDVKNAEALYAIAKKKLSHSRFTMLPDDVLDELVEAVSFRLDDLEYGEDDGADEDDFLFDDCPTYQELKKDLSSKETRSKD